MGKQKGNKNMLIWAPLVVVMLVFVVVFAPVPIDWTLSFSRKDTKPFGSKLLYELLSELGDKTNVSTAYQAPDLDDFELSNDETNYIFVNQNFTPEVDELDNIIELAGNGNNVFIAAQFFSDELKDSLKFQVDINFRPTIASEDSVSFNLANRKLQKHLGYWFHKGMTNNYFTSYDTLQTTVLGFNNEGKTNFIRQRIGDGYLFIHLNPMVFTNYHLLKNNNYNYAFRCLSYLPNQTTVWDEHYKMYRNKHKTTLSYILDNMPLRIAWYLVLIAILLFFIFESARKQRAIAIIKAPENSTVNFVETIGRLYFSRKDHLDIALKKFIYLKEFIRSKYYLNTSLIDAEFYQQLADKSSVPIRSIKQLFELGENLKQMNRLSEEDLEQFNRKIEYFYEHCQ
ncbi:DUF4350 domain-containing protein [Carboxylicivirga sp. N1Y90]|uniref:DUF4350 domain-containing protein n=1 Tax=Carboxylicivirga fragile TaxID=3417571 RepID=UPI003D3547C4|nr:DUF4350 domain-containing protein [Marinilabiliaceae bacterium N1Y90]